MQKIHNLFSQHKRFEDPSFGKISKTILYVFTAGSSKEPSLKTSNQPEQVHIQYTTNHLVVPPHHQESWFKISWRRKSSGVRPPTVGTQLVGDSPDPILLTSRPISLLSSPLQLNAKHNPSQVLINIGDSLEPNRSQVIANFFCAQSIAFLGPRGPLRTPSFVRSFVRPPAPKI